MLEKEVKDSLRYLTLLKEEERIKKEIEDLKAQQIVSKDYMDDGIPKSIFKDANDKEEKMKKIRNYFQD